MSRPRWTGAIAWSPIQSSGRALLARERNRRRDARLQAARPRSVTIASALGSGVRAAGGAGDARSDALFDGITLRMLDGVEGKIDIELRPVKVPGSRALEAKDRLDR